MPKAGACVPGAVAACFWIGCSTTIVAKRPFTEPAQGSLTIGDGCWRDENCEHGACDGGYCVGYASRKPTLLEKINEAAEGRSVQVLLDRNAAAVEAKNLKIGVVTTQWIELQRPRSVPTEALRSIALVDRGRGAVDGLGYGILSGIAAGAILGGVSGSQIPPCTVITSEGLCGANVKALIVFGAIGGAILGAPIGALIGISIGHRTTIEFEPGRLSP